MQSSMLYIFHDYEIGRNYNTTFCLKSTSLEWQGKRQQMFLWNKSSWLIYVYTI